MNLSDHKNIKKIVFIGTRSKKKNITGQSEAFEILLDKFSVSRNRIVDISISNENGILIKVLIYLKRIFDYLIAINNQEIKCIYLQIAQSKGGLIRDFIFISLAFLFKKKIIVHLHGGNYDVFYKSLNFVFKRIIKISFKHIDKAIVLSEYFKDIFQDIGFDSKKVVVIPNGIILKENIKRKEYNSKWIWIYMSNLMESKGYRDVLEAFNYTVKNADRDIELHFCGKFMRCNHDSRNIKKIEDDFFEYIKKHNLEKKVFYHGVVNNQDKWHFLDMAHFIFLPTYYEFEGQPLSIIEAMSVGVIPVCTRHRDLQNMIQDDKTGLFVLPKNHLSIFEKMSKVNPSSALEISQNTMKIAHKSYNISEHIKKINYLFNEINVNYF